MPYGWHDGGWGILWMIASWALIVAIVVLVVRASAREPSGPSERFRSARDILDERFARGEISEEEYAERKRALSGQR